MTRLFITNIMESQSENDQFKHMINSIEESITVIKGSKIKFNNSKAQHLKVLQSEKDLSKKIFHLFSDNAETQSKHGES